MSTEKEAVNIMQHKVNQLLKKKNDAMMLFHFAEENEYMPEIVAFGMSEEILHSLMASVCGLIGGEYGPDYLTDVLNKALRGAEMFKVSQINKLKEMTMH